MIRSSRWAVLALCLAATVPATAAAAPRTQPPPTKAGSLQPTLDCGRPDHGVDPPESSVTFTGPAGANDVAVGVPGASAGSTTGAGVVEVRYACAAVEGAQELRLPTPHKGDRFGASVTAAHLNDDAYDDLVVGVPGLDVGKAKDAGGIATFLGSPDGLVYSQTITQSSPDVPGSAQAGAHFGAVVSFSAERWYDDERDGLLAVGAPDKDVSGAKDAGAIVLMQTLDPSDPVYREELTLATARVPGAPGKGDHLGAAIDLAAEREFLAFGLPGRKVHGHARAGAVLTDTRSEESTLRFDLVTQDTPGFAGAAETGDGFGSSVSGAWIGVPGEDTAGVKDAGLLQSLFDGDAITQETVDVPGSSRRGDRLGETLAVWIPLGPNPDEYRVLAGMPGKKVAGVAGAGAVLNIRYLPSGSPRIAFPSVVAMPDPQRGAGFGSAITRASSQVLVGAPGAEGGRGRVAVYDSTFVNEPLALRGPWTRASGAGTKDGFGTALGGIPNLF